MLCRECCSQIAKKKGPSFGRSLSTHCQSFFWCALDGYQVLRKSGTEITHRIGPFQTIPCRCRLRTAKKKGRSHPAPVRRIEGTGPSERTIPHDAALGSSEKYLDQCHRQSKSVGRNDVGHKVCIDPADHACVDTSNLEEGGNHEKSPRRILWRPGLGLLRGLSSRNGTGVEV